MKGGRWFFLAVVLHVLAHATPITAGLFHVGSVVAILFGFTRKEN